jgi:acyl-CoA synthetase (AMP-forming)/AMP-acid ligase II
VPYTFETLKHQGFKVEAYPSLRYVTQAGGKLEAHLVADFAGKFAEAGRRFYVMYGQTEAAPRISYLPPALAMQSPGSIGKAIPGGKLYLIDDAGREIEQPNLAGELAYEGPNVMMGYATCAEELATDETPPRLLTGDIAEINGDGLFFIVGRSSRFVKPFGVRVNLDELQSHVKQSHGTCAVTGDDKHIIIAIEGKKSAADAVSVPDLMERFGLPAHIFQVRPYATLPLLSSGKYDFQTILKGDGGQQSSSSFLGRMIAGIVDILGLKQNDYASVTELYRGMLSDNSITENDSFKDLSIDSLSFVALAIEMETLFQSNLPDNWQTMSLKALEDHYQQSVARAAA